MDIVTHAVVGFATGAVFGHPWLGAVCAVLPDVVLGVRRRAAPTGAYNATHSLFCPLAGGLLTLLLTNRPMAALAVLAALLSHIAIDLPTHGKHWAPPLLYPLSKKRCVFGCEWEFFNDSWLIGFGISTLWVIVCTILSAALSFDIGSLS